MPLPKPYFLRRTPGPDTFNTARALVKHLLTSAQGPQTTRALFAASTQLERIPGSDTPLKRVVKKDGEEKEGQHVVRSLSYLKAVIHDLKTRNQIEQVQIPSPHTHRKHIFAWQPFKPKNTHIVPAKKPKAPWLPSALAAIRLGGDLTHLNRRKRRKAVQEVRIGALRLHSQADLERREREAAEEVRRRAERKARFALPPTEEVGAVEARA